jgi:hypothetical protein
MATVKFTAMKDGERVPLTDPERARQRSEVSE